MLGRYPDLDLIKQGKQGVGRVSQRRNPPVWQVMADYAALIRPTGFGPWLSRALPGLPAGVPHRDGTFCCRFAAEAAGAADEPDAAGMPASGSLAMRHHPHPASPIKGEGEVEPGAAVAEPGGQPGGAGARRWRRAILSST
jgi:hypothetical protein